jgi:hypothetical protein
VQGFFQESKKKGSRIDGEFHEEADVFSYLGLAYVAPPDRSI